MAIEDLAGFGIRGFRSFGSEHVEWVGQMSNVHMVVGKNNVGKSNVLKIAQRVLPAMRGSGFNFPEASDNPEGWQRETQRTIRIGLNLTDAVRERLQFATTDQPQPSPFEILMTTEAFSHGIPESVWFDFDVTLQALPETSVVVAPSATQFNAGLDQANDGRLPTLLQQTSTRLSQQSGGDFHNYVQIMTWLNLWSFIPDVAWVEAKRTIGDSQLIRQGDTLGPTSFQHGRGLLGQLSALERPEAGNLGDREKWKRLERFVQSVLEDPVAQVTISSSQSDLMVETGGRIDSYKNLGTGIGEVVHLAAATSVVSGHLICIEEPELHLHPTLQRKMLQYFAEDTSNRYLIATHSAAFLDSQLASISHVAINRAGWSEIQPIRAREAHSFAVRDLGNRPSDLVQSNFLVWVEGPSDRIYLNHWLANQAPELLEGAHYSIMFYGGGLLNHLSYEDDEVQGLIELAQINRDTAIVIDSDISSAHKRLGKTKVRVAAEFNKVGALVWITDGYTIENYAPHDEFMRIVNSHYAGQKYEAPDSKYASPLGEFFAGSTSYKPSKVTVARLVAEADWTFETWPATLRAKVAELASRIRAANGLN